MILHGRFTRWRLDALRWDWADVHLPLVCIYVSVTYPARGTAMGLFLVPSPFALETRGLQTKGQRVQSTTGTGNGAAGTVVLPSGALGCPRFIRRLSETVITCRFWGSLVQWLVTPAKRSHQVISSLPHASQLSFLCLKAS